MSIKQLMINSKINAFAADLLFESFLKSPIADAVFERGTPLNFAYPINRSDTPKWAGAQVTIMPIKRNPPDTTSLADITRIVEDTKLEECLSEKEPLIHRDSRQRAILDWANSTFGTATASNTEERIRRLIEEALELAQAVGLEKRAVQSLTDYVYSRPVGNVKQEIGQVGVALLGLAEYLDMSAEQEELNETLRILAKDPAHFPARQNAKAAAGIGLKSTTMQVIAMQETASNEK
jgi:NTP pyrophosphatase (non-canonical NTP hydrolase)